MEIGTISGEEGSRDDGSQAIQSTETPEELFFMDPDHEKMRINQESKVQNFGEAGLMTESLNALNTGEVEHLRHNIIDQEQKTIQQIPELQ